MYVVHFRVHTGHYTGLFEVCVWLFVVYIELFGVYIHWKYVVLFRVYIDLLHRALLKWKARWNAYRALFSVYRSHIQVSLECTYDSFECLYVYRALLSAYSALLSVYTALLGVYRALWSVCRALLSVYRALWSVYRALWSIHRALLRVYKSLLSVYWALWSVQRVLWSIYKALLSVCSSRKLPTRETQILRYKFKLNHNLNFEGLRGIQESDFFRLSGFWGRSFLSEKCQVTTLSHTHEWGVICDVYEWDDVQSCQSNTTQKDYMWFIWMIHHKKTIRDSYEGDVRRQLFAKRLYASHSYTSHIFFLHHVYSISANMGWLRLVRSLKLLVSFAKEPYKRDYILQKRPIKLRSLLIVATP